MLDESLKFTILDEVANTNILCEIYSILPINNQEAIILFTDYSTDSNKNILLKYGRLVKDGNEYQLLRDVDDNYLEQLKNTFYADLKELGRVLLNNRKGDANG